LEEGITLEETGNNYISDTMSPWNAVASRRIHSRNSSQQLHGST